MNGPPKPLPRFLTAEVERAGLAGRLLEALVLADLHAWREGATPRPEILYWRTASGAEVDFVIERAGKVFPIEVKSGDRPRLHDARHLQAFLEEYGKSSPHGILLHGGTRAERLAGRVWAVPLSAVLGPGKPPRSR